MADEKINIIINAKDNASKVLGGLHEALGTIARVGVAAAGAALVGLGAVLTDSVKAAMESEEIQAQLNAVLKSTGGAAGVTADAVNNLATELSKVTRYEDDAIISGQNMLLTFTGIGKDVFPDATEAMLDMSQAMGQDLKTTAIQLGKALNNPAEGLTALSRVGVRFTDEQKKMIEAMVEAGDIAGAQKIILAELQTEFGGSAQAAGETFAGKLDILKNRIGEVKESIGGALIPVITQFIDNAIMPLIPGLERIAAWFGELLSGGFQMPAMLQPMQDAMANLFSAIQESAPVVISALQGIWAFVQEVFAIVAPTIIQNLSDTVNIMADLWSQHGAAIIAGIQVTFQVLTAIIGGALSLISGIVKAAFALIQGDEEAFDAAIISGLTGFLNAVLSLTGMNLDEFTLIWQTNFDNLKTIVSTGIEIARQAILSAVSSFVSAGAALVEGIKSGISGAWGAFKTWISNQVGGIIDAVKAMFGIASPSKVFAGIGENLMLGLGQGINNAAGVPAYAATKAAQSVVNNTYNLTIHEAGGRGNVVNDFNLLKALTRA